MRIEGIGRLLSAVILFGALQSCNGSDSGTTAPPATTSPPAPWGATATLTLKDGSQIDVVADDLEIYWGESTTDAQKQTVHTFLQNQGAVIMEDDVDTNTVRIKVPPSDLARLMDALAAFPGVVGVEPNMLLQEEADPDPKQFSNPNCVRPFPYPACDTWLNVIAARQAWDVVTGNASQTIGLVDARLTESLEGKTLQLVSGFPLLYSSFEEQIDPSAGHGTRVAGIMAADGRDTIGVAGLAWDNPVVAALPRRAPCPSNPEKDCFVKDSHVDGLRATIQSLPAGQSSIVNMSAGIDTTSPLARQRFRRSLTRAIRSAKSRDVLLVFSAGNGRIEGDNVLLPPVVLTGDPLTDAQANTDQATLVAAWESNAIIVGAVDTSRQKSSSYTYGTVVGLYAPGVNVGSIINNVCPKPPYKNFVNCGTSYAAPQVTGAAALVAAANPTFTAPQIKGRLVDSACQVGGTKILNASRAVQPTISPLADIAYMGGDLTTNTANQVVAWNSSTDAPQQCA